MQLNFMIMALAAIIPMIIGFIWYNPKVMGNAWMASTGLNEEKLKEANMAVILVSCYVLSLFLSLSLNFVVVHQYHMYSIFANDPGMKDPNSEISKMIADFMSKYGQNFRTFKHGAFHGGLTSIFMALPLIGINALFERKSWKYIFIHVGYWFITLALMGGLICAYA